jgi:hypothetical protein
MRDDTALRKFGSGAKTLVKSHLHFRYALISFLYYSPTNLLMHNSSYILLPYGLNSQYQSYHTGDDDLRTQCGPPRFYTASLLELSKLDHLVTQRKLKTAGQQQNSMDFQRSTKKINMGPVIGTEKRGRAKRKSQISVRKISQAGSKSEPSIRVGASQDLPITLDSDDDAPAGTRLRQVR